jgi:protein TonB
VVASVALQKNPHLRRQDFIAVNLVELAAAEKSPPAKLEPPPKQPLPEPRRIEPEQVKTPAKAETIRPERQVPPAVPRIEDRAKMPEVKPAVPVKTDNSPSLSSNARSEGGGSEAGAGDPSGRTEVAGVGGPGTAGGGGGTAASGLGRGAGPPGLPAQSVLRTNREAKPIQTVRANYPPMALRAGLEGDVTLKLEVDAQGSVTKAEIAKSGGAGFDEEALKAVKQSRFEPAQKAGQFVAAEFTYIYRFRIQR